MIRKETNEKVALAGAGPYMLYDHEGVPCIFEEGATEGVVCEDLIPIRKPTKPPPPVKSAPTPKAPDRKAPKEPKATPKVPDSKIKDAPKVAPVHGAPRPALLKGMRGVG